MTSLVVGAELLVRGAADLGRRLHMSELLIGLTVVAFGTSAPELAANIAAALRGSTSMALANVTGSNLFNIGFILGLCALVRPLRAAEQLIRVEIPFLIALSATCLSLSWLGSSLGRWDGAVLVAAFGIGLWISFARSKRSRDEPGPPRWSVWIAVLLIVIGLSGLLVGAHFAVEGAVRVGRALGLSERLVGLTILAAGTSLPELATSLVASVRGRVDMAIGNVVGSNLFNIAFIAGSTALVMPVESPPIARIDVAASLALAVVLLPVAVSQRQISRIEGGAMLAAYLAYVTVRVLV